MKLHYALPGRGGRFGRRGLTFLELTVVMAISLVAVSIFSTTVVATARQRAIDRERSIAAEAARSIVERMRNENFLDIFALYNADPNDDPGGPGTAPGHRIAVPGLRAQTSSQDGMIGEIIFPAVELDGGGGLPVHRTNSRNQPLGAAGGYRGSGLGDAARFERGLGH